MPIGEPGAPGNVPPKKKPEVINIDDLNKIDEIFPDELTDAIEYEGQEQKDMEKLIKETEDAEIVIEGEEGFAETLERGQKEIITQKARELEAKEDKNILAFGEVVRQKAKSWGLSQENTDKVIMELAQEMRSNGTAAVLKMREIVTEERINDAVEKIAALDEETRPEAQFTN